jgi:hypothetical protein
MSITTFEPITNYTGTTVRVTGSNSGGTQALYFTIPQTTFNNVTYAAFSGSINVTAELSSSPSISPAPAPAPALTPTVVHDVLYNNGNTTSYVQYTNGVGVSFTYDIENGNNIGYLIMSLLTNSNANNVQWSMSNNASMNMTSSGGTVTITGSGSYPGGTQALYFTIPQTTFNNVTYAAFSGSINVTATNVS